MRFICENTIKAVFLQCNSLLFIINLNKQGT
jgi:hypothetical protein